MNPVIKWAGGKRGLLKELLKHIPQQYGNYHEPFFGAGALGLNLLSYWDSNNIKKRIYINDANHNLIAFYRCLLRPDHKTALYNKIEEHFRMCLGDAVVGDTSYYYSVRNNPQKALSGALQELSCCEVGARFYFLIKTAYNGLWRENKSGGMNAPVDAGNAAKICDKSLQSYRGQLDMLQYMLVKYSEEVQSKSFDHPDVLSLIHSGDLVYFDPPYHTMDNKYTSSGFGEQEHIRLAEVTKQLADDGVYVILSQNDTPLIRELYQGFEIHEVVARQSIAANAKRRGVRKELIICNG